ncbi:hypothetical protein [Flavicella sediminum]|uniref:hypothetical protein n=1 Tax=Flavicella sediminum TaxID=2585141 RepID=UPI00112197C6|nr:hypothetical protein [Flavicella sediminum]
MRASNYFSAILLFLTIHISCTADHDLKYESPTENLFTDFTIDNNVQFTHTAINLSIESSNYETIEVTFVDQIGVPYTPPKTEPEDGESLEDLANVFIPSITKIDDLNYSISGTKLRPDEFLYTSSVEFLVQIKVTDTSGKERIGARKIYFQQDDTEFIQYKLDNEHSFIGDENNINFTTDTYSEIAITLMDEEGVPSVPGDADLVTLEKINDLKFTISATQPTEQLIEIAITTASGVDLVEYRTVHFYAHGTVDNYKTLEGIELGVDTTEKLLLIHGTPVQEDKLTSEDGLTERWQYLSDGIGFEVNTQTQIIEKIYYYSTLYEDYPASSPHLIEEGLKYKMEVMKAKHPVNNIDITPTNGTLQEATPDGNGGFNEDGVYYFDFENIGRFIYTSGSIGDYKNKFVVQVIIG